MSARLALTAQAEDLVGAFAAELTTNSGLISGSAVSCEPGTTRHYATLETGQDGR